MNAASEAVFSLVKNKQSESHVSGCKEAKENFLIGLCVCWTMFASLCNSTDSHPIFFYHEVSLYRHIFIYHKQLRSFKNLFYLSSI